MADVKKRETESREAAYRERLRFRAAEADKQLGLVVACRERLRIAKQAVDHPEACRCGDTPLHFHRIEGDNAEEMIDPDDEGNIG